jgi:ribonuclease HI
MPSYPSRNLFSSPPGKTPEHYLIAHSDGGARGNPGPAGYGVVVQDQAGQKVAALSQYLGHQTNNFAEYQGLIAALEYAIDHGHKALKVISDSELLVRQIKGVYKVKNATLQELHARAKQLIAQLDWFSIDHALREHNREADDLANQAMDKGTGRAATATRVATPTHMATPSRVASPSRVAAGDSPATASSTSNEFEGVVKSGMIRLLNGELPEGTRVQVRVKK